MTSASPATRTIGIYHVLDSLHATPIGEFCRAFDPRLCREVGLKLLSLSAVRDPAIVEQFRDEARLCGGLRHQRIVTIYECGEADGHLYTAMEFLPGVGLHHILAKGPRMATDRALSILDQVADALDYLHAQGLVHQDIKAANVVIGPGDSATLVDFGLVMPQGGPSHFATGTILGTPAYMSPETGKGRLGTAASDRYSFGVMAFELLAGRLPFLREDAHAYLYAHATEKRPVLSVWVPEVGKAADMALERAMALDPNERWPSAKAMVDTLKRAAANAPKALRGSRGPVSGQKWRSGSAAIALVSLTIMAGLTFWRSALSRTVIDQSGADGPSSIGPPQPVVTQDADLLSARVVAKTDTPPAPPTPSPTASSVLVASATRSPTRVSPPVALPTTAPLPPPSQPASVPADSEERDGSTGSTADPGPSTDPDGALDGPVPPTDDARPPRPDDPRPTVPPP